MIGRTLVAAALAFPAASAAAPELRMHASSSPATIAFPRPAPVSYRLTVTATGQDETFAVQFDAPFYGSDPAGSSPNGTSLQFAGPPTVTGAARLLGPASSALGVIGCGPTVSVHGFETQRWRWDVLAPAGTTSTITFTGTPAFQSPWPDTSYDVTFLATPRLASGGRGTLARTYTTTARGPRPTGRRGVHLTLTSRPKARVASLAPIHVRPGQRILLEGTTSPRRAHARIRLYDPSVRLRWLKTTRTDAAGRFRTTIRAPRHAFQVMAVIPARLPRFAADNTCPLGFRVR